MPLIAPTRMDAVLRILYRRYPGFAQYCRMESDVTLNAHVAIIRNGQLVKLADTTALPLGENDQMAVSKTQGGSLCNEPPVKNWGRSELINLKFASPS